MRMRRRKWGDERLPAPARERKKRRTAQSFYHVIQTHDLRCPAAGDPSAPATKQFDYDRLATRTTVPLPVRVFFLLLIIRNVGLEGAEQAYADSMIAEDPGGGGVCE